MRTANIEAINEAAIKVFNTEIEETLTVQVIDQDAYHGEEEGIMFLTYDPFEGEGFEDEDSTITLTSAVRHALFYTKNAEGLKQEVSTYGFKLI